jgi:hypothetical protein
MTLDGSPCAAPVLGGDGRFCIAHDPARREAMRAARRRGGLNKAKPRLGDVLRDRVEAEAEAIIGAYVTALHDEDADHETRMRAADRLLDRVYGRPRQGVELSGPGGDPLGGSAGRLVVEDELVREKAREFRALLMAGDAGPVRSVGE